MRLLSHADVNSRTHGPGNPVRASETKANAELYKESEGEEDRHRAPRENHACNYPTRAWATPFHLRPSCPASFITFCPLRLPSAPLSPSILVHYFPLSSSCLTAHSKNVPVQDEHSLHNQIFLRRFDADPSTSRSQRPRGECVNLPLASPSARRLARIFGPRRERGA